MKAKLLGTARFFIAPLAFLAINACSSDTIVKPPEGSKEVTENDREQLEDALNNEAILQALLGGPDSNDDPSAGFVLELILSNVSNIGSIDINVPQATLSQTAGTGNGPAIQPAEGISNGSYKAFAAQVIMAVKEGSSETIYHQWNGIVAMNNLANPTDIIIANITRDNNSSSFPGLPSGSVGSTENMEVSAAYIHISGNQTTPYYATSGQISFSSVSFASGEKSCPLTGYSILDIIPELKITSCKAASGVMKGSFGFTARRAGSTDATITIPSTSFNLPATRNTISASVPAENAD